jgi:hypothetical protein
MAGNLCFVWNREVDGFAGVFRSDLHRFVISEGPERESREAVTGRLAVGSFFQAVLLRELPHPWALSTGAGVIAVFDRTNTATTSVTGHSQSGISCAWLYHGRVGRS